MLLQFAGDLRRWAEAEVPLRSKTGTWTPHGEIMRNKMFILITSILSYGCASSTAITYLTEPPGAVIAYKDGSRTFGASPQRLTYHWDLRFIENGCLKTKGITAKWVDGTTSSTPDIITVCGGQREYEYKLSKVSQGDNSSGSNKERVITVGQQLTSHPSSCLLYLDSVAVSAGQVTLNLYVYNSYDYIKGKFSVDAVHSDNGSETYLSGLERAKTYLLSGKAKFSIVASPAAAVITVNTTCDSTANSVKIPLHTPHIQDAMVETTEKPRGNTGPNEVRLMRDGGVYEVPVNLNGVLDIRFILDSGASDVAISPDVALTLLRTGTIGESDWLEGAYYKFADGTSAKSKRFRLKSVKIGERVIHGVTCSISNSISAPMLLGQSVLERLGKYTIDYKKGVLVFE